MILSFDTSGAHCAVLVWRAGLVLAAQVEHMKTGQSERLFPMVEAVLDAAEPGIDAVERIAVGTGPGNFTGTRIGVAAARGLALSLGVQAVGVSRLTALGFGQTANAAIAAHRDQAYVQGFAQGAAEGPPELVAVADLDHFNPLICDASLDRAGAISMTDVLATMAAIANDAPSDAPPPAPYYLRGPDAALPADPPPVILS